MIANDGLCTLFRRDDFFSFVGPEYIIELKGIFYYDKRSTNFKIHNEQK